MPSEILEEIELSEIQCAACSGESLPIMSHSFDLIPMKRYEMEQLKQELTIISGLAELIADDGVRVTAKAEQIIRRVSKISELMGWHTEGAEIREAVAASKNPDAHLGSEASE